MLDFPRSSHIEQLKNRYLKHYTECGNIINLQIINALNIKKYISKKYWSLFSALNDYTVSSTLALTQEVPFDFISITLPREEVDNDDDFESFRIDISDPFGVAPSNVFFTGTVVTILNFRKF